MIKKTIILGNHSIHYTALLHLKLQRLHEDITATI